MNNTAFTGRELTRADFDSFVSFDIETTGLGAAADVIEIGALKVENGKITGEFSQLIKPTQRISYFITNLTGITNDMVKDAPDALTAFRRFVDFCGDGILLGHNIVSFDCSVLNKYAESLGINMKNDLFDTLRHIRYRCALDPRPENNRLTTLCDFFGINPETHHRACADAYAASELYFRLKALGAKKE